MLSSGTAVAAYVLTRWILYDKIVQNVKVFFDI